LSPSCSQLLFTAYNCSQLLTVNHNCFQLLAALCNRSNEHALKIY